MNYNPPQKEFLDLIRYAYLRGASDIHVEPEKDSVRVRARIDGIMTPIKTVEAGRKVTFQENTKALLHFDMSKYGIAQDSRFSHPYINVDCRANLVGALYGEKLCLRLLERNKDFSLDKYSLPQKTTRLLKRLIRKGQGLIVVSGPTGSGKSTLLYSILGSIDRERKAVYTIEDPVEYSLSELIQIPIGKTTSFADALRARRRQEQEVIMVGEIRDQETAHAAIHAANTGHLVLTTVHANSAEEIFTRFQALGVPPEIVKPVTLFASAQRLPKQLCKSCRHEDTAAVTLAEHIFNLELDFVPKKAVGCDECSGLGVKGRILIFEHIEVGSSETGVRTLKAVGSLKQQAFCALKGGLIDANEAYNCISD